MILNRLVLDTNVCLDLFVFEDTRWNALAAALRSAQVQAVTREDCRVEWLMVLGYARFALTPERQASCIAQFDSLITHFHQDAATVVRLGATLPLPRCTDQDDQKFLELAHHAAASTLITKDKALLKLAGKCRRLGYFTIVRPDAWSLALHCP